LPFVAHHAAGFLIACMQQQIEKIDAGGRHLTPLRNEAARPTAKAPEPPAVSESKANPGNLDSPRRHLLPKDLAGALKRLDDIEIDALLAAVTTEAERRGRRPPIPTKEKVPVNTKPQPRHAPPKDGLGSLTTGKLNAVRAAFKAGVD
jgi:hypothetical protein